MSWQLHRDVWIRDTAEFNRASRLSDAQTLVEALDNVLRVVDQAQPGERPPFVCFRQYGDTPVIVVRRETPCKGHE